MHTPLCNLLAGLSAGPMAALVLRGEALSALGSLQSLRSLDLLIDKAGAGVACSHCAERVRQQMRGSEHSTQRLGQVCCCTLNNCPFARPSAAGGQHPRAWVCPLPPHPPGAAVPHGVGGGGARVSGGPEPGGEEGSGSCRSLHNAAVQLALTTQRAVVCHVALSGTVCLCMSRAAVNSWHLQVPRNPFLLRLRRLQLVSVCGCFPPCRR